MNARVLQNHYDTLVIGAGQGGLAAAYELQRAGLRFLVLDADARVGDTWRRRWDSLRLFTPAVSDALPGLPFPAPPRSFPTKEAQADYLEAYAKHFELPVVSGARVTRVSRSEAGFVVETSVGRFSAAHVIVASGSNARPNLPAAAHELAPHLKSIHSGQYRRPSDLPAGPVLVVGFGTSGAQIALELCAAGHEVLLSGKPKPRVPRRFLRIFGALYWLFVYHVLTIDTRLGRKLAPKIVAGGAPLIGIDPKQVYAAGIEAVGRVTGTDDGRPVVAEGRRLEVASVVWCTGYSPSYEFLDLPELRFDALGWPRAPYGASPDVPGLYFMGVPYQYGLTSAVIGGAARDARLVVSRLEEHGKRAATASVRALQEANS